MAPSPNSVRRLTAAYRLEQVRLAAQIAALIASAYRSRVAMKDQAGFNRWLDLVVPKIMEAHEESAVLGAKFANANRKLELPDLRDGFKFEPLTRLTEPQLRTSLSVVGPTRQAAKAAEIATRDLPLNSKVALLRDAKAEAEKAVAASTLRHVQNGARETIERGSKDNEAKDPAALGYVRITRANPCFFCAMLASRGMEYGVYGEDSFAASDARFVGPGTAKVHDNCQCGLKPVYRLDDEILADNQRFEAMWYDLSGDGDADPLTNFRRGYEGRNTTKAA